MDDNDPNYIRRYEAFYGYKPMRYGTHVSPEEQARNNCNWLFHQGNVAPVALPIGSILTVKAAKLTPEEVASLRKAHAAYQELVEQQKLYTHTRAVADYQAELEDASAKVDIERLDKIGTKEEWCVSYKRANAAIHAAMKRQTLEALNENRDAIDKIGAALRAESDAATKHDRDLAKRLGVYCSPSFATVALLRTADQFDQNVKDAEGGGVPISEFVGNLFELEPNIVQKAVETITGA